MHAMRSYMFSFMAGSGSTDVMPHYMVIVNAHCVLARQKITYLLG
jgi:hypothetical protein